jgi:hypothetical protein
MLSQKEEKRLHLMRLQTSEKGKLQQMLERDIEEHPFPKPIPKNLNNLFFA